MIIAVQGTTGSVAQLLDDAQIMSGSMPKPLTDDAVALFTAVKTAANGGTIPVTGHSMGGTTAEWLARQDSLGGATFGATGLPGNATPGGGNTSLVDYVNYGDPDASRACTGDARASRLTVD